MHHMLIDGQLVAGSATLPVIDPATEEVFTQVPDCSAEELDRAIAAARRAFPSWSRLGFEQRLAPLRKIPRIIEAHIDELAASLSREQGKPLSAARQELQSTIRFMDGQCLLQLPQDVNEDTPTRRSITRRVPLGVVAALAPWNFPVLLAWWKVIPALLAGNTLVLKPSPNTPATVLRIAELTADLLPPGVLNVISGGHELGPRLTAHAGVDKISFTGSTQTGRRVMESASSSLKRLTLELGGNDAAIILPDADFAMVVPAIFWAAFANSGQVCIASKRIYVPASRYDEFAQAFVAFARTVKVGPASDETSQLGPVQNRQQYDRVRELIEHSREEGLNVLYEGEAPSDKGYFIPVTIFDNPGDSTRIVQEEPFGPALPLLKYDTIEEAIERANASAFGLAGSVWGRDEEQAQDVASRLHTGTVWINETMYLAPNAPFAGHKQSGFGVEHGVEGLLSFTQPQTIVMRRA